MKVILILCMLLYALSASADIWTDDFEREELGEDWIVAVREGQIENADWKITEGVLKGHWPNWNGQMLYVKGYNSLNYTIQVRCKIDIILGAPDLAGAGFFFRSSGPGDWPSGYCFAILKDNVQFTVFHGNGDPMDFLLPKPEIHALNHWYTLKLRVNDDLFQAYVDDVLIDTLQHKNNKGEFVGLVIGSNIDASFDDFMISDRVDEDALKDFSVSPEGKLTTTWGYVKQK